ncbi:TetR/AcrR family transcriptional regulator [Lactiplantibacillus herbarum]|uniref:TetR/AcrR family transcriptional regulator n=1 Tax=Lactiplantibacillus herbarum TaxID=1670446 RepID=UPI00064EFD64|nr:TetR/AcrR family transcriptional regulator [Lactiplantibacillus herbarum]
MKINNVETLFEKTLQDSQLSLKQQDVLKASLKLFAIQGFDRTTSSEIAAQAGVSEGTVFKQFKTEQGILKALLEPFIEQVIPMAATEFLSEIKLNQFSDFESFLHYVIQDRMTFAVANLQQLKVFLQEIIHNPKVLETLSTKWATMVRGNINRLLGYFKQQGQLVDWPDERIIRYFVSTVLGYILPLVLFDVTGAFDVEQKSAEATEFLVCGLTPKSE